MSDFERDLSTPSPDPQPSSRPPAGGISTSRRRLLKLGSATVPVIATLSSRPAFAWHCQSPSAWGSEQLNPNTSLIGNAGHMSYPDETWTISNWQSNSARSATGYSGKPWDVLLSKYPALKPLSGQFDYTKVTITKLCSVVTSITNPGCAGSSIVKTVLTSGSDLQKYTLVAQLNYLLLSPLAANEVEKCLAPSELRMMASGSYSPQGLGVSWGPAEIKKFLSDNYIAQP